MNTKDKLEILLITYNRAEELKESLEVLLAENSPVKDFDIKIIDNNSNDDTKAVVYSLMDKHKNLKYEKNKYNLGLAGNIVKAFYVAEKEYVWVLADNDHYCWDSWNEVENAIEKGMDAIMVSKFTFPETDTLGLFLQGTFTPGVIYKTSNITDEVMGNMTYSIHNLFPHMALFSYILNHNKSIYLVDKAIVSIGDNRDKKTKKYSYVRGFNDSDLHPLQKQLPWAGGYANILYFIKDKKLRNYLATYRHNGNPINTIQIINGLKNKDLFFLASIFCVLSKRERFLFVLKVLYYYTFYFLINVRYKYKRFEDMSYERKLILRILFINITLYKEKLNSKKIGNKKFMYKNLYTKDNL